MTLGFAQTPAEAQQGQAAQADEAPPSAWETPPVFHASKILPAEMQAGPHFRVRELAPSDGYLIHFTIDSDYGTFHCAGLRELNQRVGEIAAIAKLVEVSKSDLFAEGLKRSIEKPIDAVKNIVKDPEESLKQAPKTVGHFFSKVGSSIGNAAKRIGKSIEEAKENGEPGKAVETAGRNLGHAAMSVAGFDQAKLDTARQLGVDPYSDNPRLQEEIDKVIGLQLGADDYITKPFGVHELLARISAVLRRSQRKPKDVVGNVAVPDRFTFGVADIDARQYKVRTGEKTFDISARELQLLRFFHSHPNEVLSRDRILNAVWGIEYGGTTRTLDQHMAQLRKKIELDPAHPRFLTTVYGVGYRYEKP